MYMKVMNLCKENPMLDVQIIVADNGSVVYEGRLRECPYHICVMDVVKMEFCFRNGTDYIISVG